MLRVQSTRSQTYVSRKPERFQIAVDADAQSGSETARQALPQWPTSSAAPNSVKPVGKVTTGLNALKQEEGMRAACQRHRAARGLFAQSGNPMGQARNFALGRIAVHDILLRRPDDDRFGLGHRGERQRTIARRDRLFDFAHGGPQA
jgi:hypothetical protein